jgi:hypothetical protein
VLSALFGLDREELKMYRIFHKEEQQIATTARYYWDVYMKDSEVGFLRNGLLL